MTPETLRNGDLQTLATILEGQHHQKRDVVVPAKLLDVRDCRLVVPGLDPVLTDDGVTASEAVLDISTGALGDFASRYEVPVKYLRKCRSEDCDLFGANITTWSKRDERKVLLRTFTDPDGGLGYLRTVRSDSYAYYDHLDVLMAALDGAQSTGEDVRIESANLSETNMRVRFVAPGVAAMADRLLADYRNPWPAGDAPWQRSGRVSTHEWIPWDERKVVFAGFDIANSETGDGALVISPVVWIPVCHNGLVWKLDSVRQIHAGAKLTEGVVKWSADTIKANVELVRNMTADAIRSFMNPEYVAGVVAKLEERTATPLADPIAAIETVSNKLRYTEDERGALLRLFVAGGQATAGGILQGVTALAQEIEDADRAAEVEASAIDALMLVTA